MKETKLNFSNHTLYLPIVALLSLFIYLQPASAASIPESCQEIVNVDPGATDGEYTIYPHRRIITVQCHDMSGTPSEYLTLVNTGGVYNFSQYQGGFFQQGSPGKLVQTHYKRVRLNVDNLLVNIGDQTFATSTGWLMHGSTRVDRMPYGVAMDCVSPYSHRGNANINLYGTDFILNNPRFVVGGYIPAGTATFSPDNRSVNLTGGGFCGWIAPKYIYEPTNSRGGEALQLAFVGKHLLMIDVKPGSDTNPVNTKSNGVIPVAIMTDDFIDAPTGIDWESLTFGASGHEVSLARTGNDDPQCGVEDVNGDSRDDLVCHFHIQETGLHVGDATAILRGQTVDGRLLEGSDYVLVK